MVDAQGRDEYTENLVHLAGDIREALKLPGLPIVIGELGNLGDDADENILAIRRAQAEAARLIQPAGSALFVKTADFARPKELSPNVGHGHHYFGNAESYFLIGDAIGRGMLELLQSK